MTRETTVYHPHRYFVAAGESLRAIEGFVAEERGVYESGAKQGVREEMGAFVKQHSITGVLHRGKGDLAFKFNEAAGAEWKPLSDVKDSFEAEYFVPNLDTDAGRGIKAQLDGIQGREKEVEKKSYPQSRFAEWMDAHRVDTAPGALRVFAAFDGKESASFEKLGDKFIISVPVVNYADGVDWKTPPGAKPIPVSEYYRMHEDAGNLPLQPTSKNHVRHKSDFGDMEP